MASVLPEIERLDLADVIRQRFLDAGFNKVFLFPPSLKEHPEYVAIRFGIPDEDVCYFDFSFESTIRISVYIARINDIDAMADAQAIERILRTQSFDSCNGSYDLIGVETTRPRPIQWDESGRDIWLVEAEVHVKIND